MAARSATYNMNDVLTHAFFWYAKSPEFQDNFFDGWALMKRLKSLKAVDETLSGGALIKEFLMYGENTTAGSYRGYDVLDTTPQEGHTDVDYFVKQNGVSITISGLERSSIDGPMQVKNVLDSKIKQAQMSLRNKLNQQLFGDGSGNNYKEITGLKAITPEGGAGTYAGINSANETWWKASSKSAVGSFATNGRTAMVEFYKTLARSTLDGRPQLIIGTMNFHNFYEKSLQANERYILDSKSKNVDGGLGMDLMFKDVIVDYDFDCPVDSQSKEKAHWLNFRFLKWRVHKRYNFKVTPFQEPEDQDASVARILHYSELCTNNRRFQGLMYGIDA